jgi:acetyltransferase-like isoleucine patch superfamily enzyme
MNYFKHPTALVESPRIGTRTRIWAYAHVLPDARIGEDCNICDHTFIENDVVIGNRVTIKCGVQLWDGIVLEDDVFVGPNATFTNDPFPRSERQLKGYAKTAVGRGVSIETSASLLPGAEIGLQFMVGTGGIVARNVPPKPSLREILRGSQDTKPIVPRHGGRCVHIREVTKTSVEAFLNVPPDPHRLSGFIRLSFRLHGRIPLEGHTSEASPRGTGHPVQSRRISHLSFKYARRLRYPQSTSSPSHA